MEEFSAALGPDAVLTSEQDLREFRDPYAFASWDEFTASAVLMPSSVEQVQAIVRIANQHRVPLWTFSQGRNNSYGGPAPRVRGSVLVNLRRMNRVLEVDDELAYAVVEPGVRFMDLYDHLRAGGHRLWPSTPDLGWGSVIGNALDHGRGYGRYGDHPAAICGMEVVLASGEVLRTGMGAMANSRSWHVYQRGYGPSVDGIFLQSNFGIVTKMGVWLMPEPETYVSCWARVKGEEGLEALIDTIRPLMLDGTVPNYPLVRKGIGIGAWDASQEAWETSDDPIPPEIMERIFQERHSGWWAMRFALYGPETVVDAQWDIVREAFGRIPGAEVGGRRYTGSGAHRAKVPDDKVQGGIPGLDILEVMKSQAGEAYGHLDFSPVAPLTGREVVEMTRLIGPVIERHGLQYTPGMILTPRCVLHIGTTVYDSADEAQAQAAFDAYQELIGMCAEAGFGIYRTHLKFMDQVADTYGYNDQIQRRFNQTLKDVLDPNGILAPGKQGIWPKSMRP
ncbi:MAG: FAD-binding oxidoreductase [Candidatus Dormibacteraeota bacterium]|nr:FAD-binding oxidoreductase [Candidatus Dormibacteraeota bacterium]